MTAILPAVGVHEQHEQIHFTVYPNPAKNKLELQIDETHRNLVDSWVIYDSQGRIAIQALYLHDVSLNITSLTPGVYTLVLLNNKKMIGSKTFVKG